WSLPNSAAVGGGGWGSSGGTRACNDGGCGADASFEGAAAGGTCVGVSEGSGAGGRRPGGRGGGGGRGAGGGGGGGGGSGLGCSKLPSMASAKADRSRWFCAPPQSAASASPCSSTAMTSAEGDMRSARKEETLRAWATTSSTTARWAPQPH